MAHPVKSSVDHFGKVGIGLHWISALLIIVLLGSGFRAGFSTDTGVKTAALQVHLPVAILVLVLTVTRLIWWWRFDIKPGPVMGVPSWQESIAKWTHRGLYAVVILLLASGIAMSILSGLPDALFGSAAFPELAELPPRAGHGVAARVMVGLVVLHAGAALYHHFFLKDKTLKRIWF
ncbi:MAG: cytochrome b [Albidovulum sp.]